MKRLEIKTSEDERKAWEAQSMKDGYLSLAAWIRDVLNHQCDEKPAITLQGTGKYDRNRTE